MLINYFNFFSLNFYFLMFGISSMGMYFYFNKKFLTFLFYLEFLSLNMIMMMFFLIMMNLNFSIALLFIFVITLICMSCLGLSLLVKMSRAQGKDYFNISF